MPQREWSDGVSRASGGSSPGEPPELGLRAGHEALHSPGRPTSSHLLLEMCHPRGTRAGEKADRNFRDLGPAKDQQPTFTVTADGTTRLC